MKKVINEIKKHKKAMIGVAVIVVVFAWILITNEPAPVEAQKGAPKDFNNWINSWFRGGLVCEREVRSNTRTHREIKILEEIV